MGRWGQGNHVTMGTRGSPAWLGSQGWAGGRRGRRWAWHGCRNKAPGMACLSNQSLLLHLPKCPAWGKGNGDHRKGHCKSCVCVLSGQGLGNGQAVAQPPGKAGKGQVRQCRCVSLSKPSKGKGKGACKGQGQEHNQPNGLGQTTRQGRWGPTQRSQTTMSPLVYEISGERGGSGRQAAGEKKDRYNQTKHTQNSYTHCQRTAPKSA